jgi:hypothetical protein
VRGDEPVRLGDSLGQVVRSLRPDTAPAFPAASGAGAKSPATNSSTAMGGVFGKWSEAVGEAVAAHVQPVKLDGTTLIVEVDDPAWATQLRFLEATVCARLAEVAGATVQRVEVRVARRR